ncbi:hypothetical protein D3C86_1728920 [compost metagenome]
MGSIHIESMFWITSFIGSELADMIMEMPEAVLFRLRESSPCVYLVMPVSSSLNCSDIRMTSIQPPVMSGSTWNWIAACFCSGDRPGLYW